MEEITATELRKQLFSVLEAVEQGHTYSIWLKGVEVAVLLAPSRKAFPIGNLSGNGRVSPNFDDEISGLEEN